MHSSVITRRSLLRSSLGMVALYGMPHSLTAERESSLAGDPRRPGFHLLPTHNWMNDPNGPIYFNGRYHMFFQYNPQSAVWGNMSWNHAISDDMVHWKNDEVAFTMTPGGPDAAGCFSGSTIVAEHNGKPRVYALYTGVVRDPANETIRNEGLRESQCLAWSDDPWLRRWAKLEKPVIPTPPSGMKIVGFRDPVVWKHNGQYYMAVAAGIEHTGGCLLLYQSQNLYDWNYLHPLVSGKWSGKATSNPVDDGEMWECPDFFELNGRHVLIYSTQRKVFWKSGLLDPAKMTFQEQKSGMLDLGDFYAPKSQLDASGERILWAWLPEKRSQQQMLQAGWSGMISLPRRLTLDKEGVLKMSFLRELRTLRRGFIPTTSGHEGTTLHVPGATGEVLCQGSRHEAWTVEVTLPDGAVISLQYDPLKYAFSFDGSELPLQPSDTPSVHAFFDGSVLEILMSSRHGITRRFYYEGSTAPALPVRILGAMVKVQAWRIAFISKDKLTSPAA